MSSKLKRLVLAITLLCGLSILGIVCNANDSTDVELIPVSIALDWFPWANHSGLYVAKERGYFQEEGLDVNIYVPGDPSTVLQTVAAGKADFSRSIARQRVLRVHADDISALFRTPSLLLLRFQC